MEEKEALALAWMTLAEERLEVARQLLATSHYDDAVSRAYYVMFYSAKAALLAIGFETRSHSGVATLFSQHFVKTGRVEQLYSHMLSRAMQARDASDYDPISRFTLAEAEQIVTNAEDFLRRVKEI